MIVLFLGALALLGAAVVVVLSSLPVVGWIFKLIVILLGLGALVLTVRSTLRPQPPAASIPPSLPSAS